MDGLQVYVRFDPFLSFDEMLGGTMETAADYIVDEMLELMREPKSGRPYKHKDGAVRPASAEGEAPGIDSGDFSGGFDVISLSLLESQINNDVAHGYILEEKRNRLFTEPAIENAMPRIVDLIEETIEQKWR